MGCVSSSLLSRDDEFPQLGSAALGHHIVSLTSTTYGLLSMDPPQPGQHHSATTPPTPPQRFTLGSIFPSPLSDPRPLRPVRPESELCPARPEPEVINSWELMAGLDTADSFRFSPLPPPRFKDLSLPNKENCNPNFGNTKSTVLEKFEFLCPSNGENKVVLYTTTLRGVRSSFEACNSVRSAIEGLGVAVCERDVSMHSGFRDELRELMRGKGKELLVPPRVFVRGRYIGGAEEVMRIAEEGKLAELLEGLPKGKVRMICEGCGGVRFLPCFRCNGSCKVVISKGEEGDEEEGDELVEGGRRSSARNVVVRCVKCNENGLVLCPICS
ncbi:hypothetical protein CRG98_015235 [Punica granatum]|uniref:Glutaredoxin domain-containing protein n=1 Tax=Punica granatum TaxID=22663 RepID=A0A2I0K744_PUNGR|nr:hypothetical protein CRG98_015235 [Punica granatum]